MHFKKYLQVFKNSWQENLEFRGDTFVRFLIAFISLISIYYLWNDVYVGKEILAGYTKEQMITYYIIVGYLFSSIYASVPVTEEIRSGFLSVYLTKPMSYIAHTYAQTLARRLLRLFIGLPVVLLIFYVFRENVFLVTDPKAYVLLLFTAINAINILFLIDMILGYIEFWMLYADSLSVITDIIVRFLAGTLIPLSFLPRSVQFLSDIMPFKYTGYFIINVFLGRIGSGEILQGILIQFFWMIILFIIAKVFWVKGLKKYEAVGA